MKYYEVKRYNDDDGREIEVFYLQGGEGESPPLYKIMVPVLTDQGVQPFPYAMKAESIEDAFGQIEAIMSEHVERLKTQVAEVRKKQQNKLVTARSMPPAPANGGLILGT